MRDCHFFFLFPLSSTSSGKQSTRVSKFEAPKPQNILEPADSKVTATTERNRPSTDQNLWENGWSCFYNPNMAFSCQKKDNVFSQETVQT